jgi:hypothetical protein
MEEANKSITLNNITFRKPTMILRSDASEFGLGGNNIISGKVWRFKLPI